jgi:hypothetical protein
MDNDYIMKIINLLPKPKQQELKYEAIFHALLKVVWISVGSFVIVCLAQLGTKVYLTHQAGTLAENIKQLTEEVNKQDNTAVKDKVTTINNVVADFKNFSDTAPKWSQLVKVFVPLVPVGVHITTVTVNTKDKNMYITGFSPTREMVIQLHDNILADTQNFSDIDYPLENVSKPTNLSFHFNFLVKDSVLK